MTGAPKGIPLHCHYLQGRRKLKEKYENFQGSSKERALSVTEQGLAGIRKVKFMSGHSVAALI